MKSFTRKNDRMSRTAITLHTFKCDEHPWHHHYSAFFTLLVIKTGFLLFVAEALIINYFNLVMRATSLSVFICYFVLPSLNKDFTYLNIKTF